MRSMLLGALLASSSAIAQVGNFPALIGQRGTTAPTTCTLGQLFFDTDASAGSNILGCTSANTWTTMGGSISGSGSSGQVTLWTGASSLGGDADLTFSGSRLTATDLTVTNAPTFSAMTATRVPFSGVAGLLSDSANLVFGAGFSGDRLKVGTSNGASQGWEIGNCGNNCSHITPTERTASATDYWALYTAGSVYMNVPTNGSHNFRVNNADVLSIASTGVNFPSGKELQFASKKAAIATAPTLASGGCTDAAMVANNGTVTFTVGVGTGCSGSQPLVFTLPAATRGWNCYARNETNAATSAPRHSSGVSTTSVTMTNYDPTTGLAAAWTDSDVVTVSCLGG